MSKKVHFIPATENDAIAIVELRKQIWSTTYRGIYPDCMIDNFDYPWHKEKELQRIRRSDYAVYLITIDNLNIGYLTTRKTDIITLQSLYIVDEYQHQGIGKQPLISLSNTAKKTMRTHLFVIAFPKIAMQGCFMKKWVAELLEKIWIMKRVG